MAAQSRRADSSLRDELLERGFRFDFFQAVRLLARIYPDRQPVGEQANPLQEVVRFRVHQSLAFPPSAIAHLRKDQDERRPDEMTVAFMGLTGPQGTLPRYYSELILERLQSKDPTLRDFFDVFNHRIISLFFRAWAKHRCTVGFERWLLKGEEDRFAGCLFAFAGLGTGGLRERLAVDDRSLLRYAGLLGQRPRSAESLERCLGDYFGVPVRVNQFVGAWVKLEQADWTTIGVTGQNNILGASALSGTKVWDQQAGFKVELGPLDFEEFNRLLPSGQVYPTLVQLTKLFAGPELDFDVQLLLRADQVPPTRLHSTGTYAPRLGWTTWLKTAPFAHDADDVRFSGSTPMAHAGTA